MSGVVEIDEYLVAKIKYHRGSGLKRNLTGLKYDHVKPRTMIVSDSWRSQKKLKDFDFDFDHKTVNHSYNFVDPDSGTHTNKIKGFWRQANRKIKDINGCSRAHLQSYIDEFVWRMNNGYSRVDAYDSILDQIGHVYSPDAKLSQIYRSIKTLQWCADPMRIGKILY